MHTQTQYTRIRDEERDIIATQLAAGHSQCTVAEELERRTRYTILVPLPAFDAKSMRKAFSKSLTELPEDLRKTLTYDQGKEMADHLQLTLDTDIQVYFAHEGSPWERGTNENTNGLLRQFFPKGTDFTKVPAQRLNEHKLF